MIDERVAQGDAPGAGDLLAELWQTSASPSLAGYVLARYEQIAGARTTVPFKIGILRSFTVEPLVPLLRAGGAVGGFDLAVHLGEFNAYAQEILDPGSRLYGFQPNLVILAVQTQDIAPGLWREYADLSPADADRAADRVVEEFSNWLQTLRSRTSATIVVHTLEVPAWPSQGVLDAQVESSQVSAIRRINSRLADLARNLVGVHVLDWDGLLARHGRLNWHDARRWLTVRMPIKADKLTYVAEEWLRYVYPASGRVSKCLVCDLDNTLWGGIIGEDGMDGIKLGVEYPGAAYVALQRAILDLYRRGVILAICSKNNLADAMQVLEGHPHMLLRPNHFAAMRIDWNDKVENLRRIAEELNIGVDSLALVDDNPVECQNVRQRLPEVRVLCLSADPMGHAELLRRQPFFERLNLSEEDRQRGEMYATQRLRTELEKSATRVEDFYQSLGMKAEFAWLTPGTLPRAAQLTQKTNQFNMTTRRYTEQELTALASDPGHRVMTIKVTDRFGDNGIVGLLIASADGPAWTVDTFLLSCRVIGRTVETAILGTLAEQARAAGARYLRGEFIPTKKNAPARDVYAHHGFTCVQEQETSSRWELDLAEKTIDPPPWIERILPLSD
jgi:FkbH-like protein